MPTDETRWTRRTDNQETPMDFPNADTTSDRLSAAAGASRPQPTPHEIGWAVKQMWHGQAVRRRGWNGRNMFLKIQVPDAHSANTLPYVWIKTADGQRVPWLASQTDLLATDWEFAEA